MAKTPAAKPKKDPEEAMTVRGHPVVPENVLRTRKTTEQIKVERAERIAKQAKKVKKVGQMFKKATVFVKEYRNQQKSHRRLKREGRKPITGKLAKEVAPNLFVVVRLKPLKNADAKTKQILTRRFRLNKLNNAVFVEGNDETAKLLRLVEPFIAYGPPEMKTVRELVMKRGAAFINRKRTPLNDNQLVEDALGEKGIICLEDIVNEIFTVGPNFKTTNSFLTPFELNPVPEGEKELREPGHKKSGGKLGVGINALIERMN